MAGDAVISNLWNIFWIFLMLSMLSPQLKMKMLENARLKLIRELEKERFSSYMHDSPPRDHEFSWHSDS